jgi:hypothetical protein
MAIQYAGGTRVNYTFTDNGTRLSLVNNLNTQLKNAGWSAISGDGTGDVLMQSAMTPDGLKIRFRLLDPGSGNCAQFTMKNSTGTLTSSIGYLLPGSFDWRIVANKYQFFMFRTGSANRKAARGVLNGGTIWMPSSQVSLLGSDKECGWMDAAGTSDTDTTQRETFRSVLTMTCLSFAPSYGLRSSLYTSFMVNTTDNTTLSQPGFLIPGSAVNAAGRSSAAWQGGERHQAEALIGWSSGSANSNQWAIKGQVWDAMILSGQANGETTITYDGHTFIAITDLASDVQVGYATLYIAVD